MPDQRPGGLLADRNRSVLVVVDFQEKFRSVIHEADAVLGNLVRLVQAATILRVPILVTEQYPAGLGRTVPDLRQVLGDTEYIEKTTFGCFGEPKFIGRLEGLEVDTLVVAGIEAHVCVAQTALQAIEHGYRVHAVADAIGSRAPDCARIGLDRMRQSGVMVSCTEMTLFEWLGKAGSPEFKEVQRLIKEQPTLKG